MKTEHIITAILLIVILLFIWNNNKEHLTGTEAVFNISKVYADASGTANFNNIKSTGNLDVSGNATFSGATLFNGNTTFKSSIADMPTYFPFSDGTNYIRGPTNIDGRAQFNNGADFKGGTTPGNNWTHFPYSDGRNYIRGPVVMDDGIYSGNGQYMIVLQGDGNLCATRKSDNKVYWCSGIPK